MKRQCAVLASILLLLVGLLSASCGTSRSGSSTQPDKAATTYAQVPGAGATPDSNAPPGNFLYNSTNEVMFLAWVENNGTLSGQTQDAQIANSYGNEQVNTNHGSFTGMLSNGQVSLNFGGFLGYQNTITGTFDGTTLTLNFPLTTGNMGAFTFVPGTVDDYNNAVGAMQQEVDKENAAVAQANAQATAVANQQAAVANANTSVGNDISSIQNDRAGLNQAANFDSVFSDYASTWQQMQNDYQVEVNASKNGCGDGGTNYGTVQVDAGTVQVDEGSIQVDDGSYDVTKNGIDGLYGNVQQDITNLKNDWQTLQQAVANNTTGTPASNYSQSDIDNAVGNGNNALSNADGVVAKAKQQRATYDNEASALNNQAQALPGTMGC